MATATTYGGIAVPNFKSKGSRLYADLLKKQLGYAGQAAGYYDDPSNLTEDYWSTVNRGMAGDSTGAYLADITGDSGARGAYDLAQQNQATMGYNDLIKSVFSPGGMEQIKRMQMGLYGPEGLSMLDIMSRGGGGGQKGPGILGQALGVASTAAGMGWSPFG